MAELKFTKSFTQQESIPREGIVQAIRIMQTGRLHRYNIDPDEQSQASLLEAEFAKWQETEFCLACTSGGYAIQLALRVCGVKSGDKVLANAYTLAPVPGAIQNVGAEPIFVEIDENYHIDINDLTHKVKESGAKYLLLSHMRGHIVDMDKITSICNNFGIKLIEDCAHTMGAKWGDVRSGNFGLVGAFSTQTYKHMNSGEGGFLTTCDPEIAAKAVVSSGSYMLYDRHGAIPEERVFRKVRQNAPNYSGRMDQIRASLLRAQLPNLENNIRRWNTLYDFLFSGLSAINGVTIPKRVENEFYVGSSIQFRTEGIKKENIPDFVKSCSCRGVDLKWFGDEEPKAFTSRYDSWSYIKNVPVLSNTLLILDTTLDMRIPLTFTLKDCSIIIKVIQNEIAKF